MEIQERLSVIDTMNNRGVIANKIADDIFKEYDISNNVLREWLLGRLSNYSLYDLVSTKYYLIINKIGQKCIHDINATIPLTSANINDIMLDLGGIGRLVLDVIGHISKDELDNAIKGFASDPTLTTETLVINGKEYKLGIASDTYCTATFHIGYHPNYATTELERRVRNRLAYRTPHYCKVLHLRCWQDEDKSYYVYVEFDINCADIDILREYLFHRFTKSSGKPWYRCEIDQFSVKVKDDR